MPHARKNEHSLAANKQFKTVHYIKTMDGLQWPSYPFLSTKKGLSNLTIAEYLNISSKTAWGQITKTHKLLRDCFGKQVLRIFYIAQS